MLIRWLILQLCRSRAELRCVIRVVHAYLAAQHATAQERTSSLHSSNLFQCGALQPRHHVKDARVRYSACPSIVYVTLVVQAELPRILTAAIVAVSIAPVMGALYVARVLG